MLLGIRSVKTVLTRHTIVGALTFGVWYFFWMLRPEWTADMRMWRAVGDAGFILLFLILIIGPLARTWTPFERLNPWRRELGIWFGVIALFHPILILDGWVQWDLMRLMGYQYLPQLERWSRVDPGFGLSNLIGLIAVFWAMVLAATSSDKLVNFLGEDSWKWLHGAANTIFYLTAAHVGYFLFIHYTLSSHRPVPDPNWFRWPFLIMAILVFILQVTAFVLTVRKNKKRNWY